ncbi:MAG: hypothetical protein Kow0025_05780 [Thermodesulfovibrionales bacterium]
MAIIRYATLIVILALLGPALAAGQPAEQVRSIPLVPAWQSPGGQGVPSAPVPAPQLLVPAEAQRARLPRAPQSDFELYVSEKLVITETQFDIIRKKKTIEFSPERGPVPAGYIAVPVKVVEPSEGKGELKNAGYLIGPPEELGEVLRLLDIRSPLSIPTDLGHFGYEIFREPPSTFAPAADVPVGPDYVIGPGDEMRVTVWGKVEGQWTVTVDRDGTIAVPRAGVVGVAGLTFAEAKDLLHKELSKYYTGFEMSVSMGALRTMRVYVVGNARNPGAYTLSSLSTLLNALLASGGPDTAGTLRDVQLKRAGETIAHFDVYDFLVRGDKSGDRRLSPGDVIFIPPAGPRVALAGSVRNPAIFELKGETTLSALLEMAGGLEESAFEKRVQVERVSGSARTVFEAALSKAGDMALRPGDVIRIFPVVEDRRTVTVAGAVKRTGEYGFREGMSLADLVEMARGLEPYAYTPEAELTRLTITDEGPRYEKTSVNLAKALAGDASESVPLAAGDYLLVRPVPEWRPVQTVKVMGEVRFPGTYTLGQGERLSSVLERAGGFTDKAYLRGAVFTRQSVKALQERQLSEMIDRLERDLLGVEAAETAAVLTPEEARIKGIEFSRMRAFIEKMREARALGRMSVALADPENLKGTPYDLELKPGDSLFVPANPESVQVIGAVFNQSAFVYTRENDVSDYIGLAGGYTSGADKKMTYILKVDGTAVRLRGGSSGVVWNPEKSRWEARQKDLEPGDTIVVPEDIERVAWLREVKDITQILYQIAVTAGVLIVAF